MMTLIFVATIALFFTVCLLCHFTFGAIAQLKELSYQMEELLTDLETAKEEDDYQPEMEEGDETPSGEDGFDKHRDSKPMREVEIPDQYYNVSGLLAKCDLVDSSSEANNLTVSGQVFFDGSCATDPMRRVAVTDGMIVHVSGLSPVRIKLMPLPDVPPTRPGQIAKLPRISDATADADKEAEKLKDAKAAVDPRTLGGVHQGTCIFEALVQTGMVDRQLAAIRKIREGAVKLNLVKVDDPYTLVIAGDKLQIGNHVGSTFQPPIPKPAESNVQSGA